MAYDAARGNAVLFGGRNDATSFMDTWTWVDNGDNGVWTRAAETGPSMRSGAAMAYDSQRSQIVLFGGFGATRLSDTWEWDGGQWLDATPAASPPRRVNAAMAYDASRERIVMFGGADGITRFGDTWEWDGAEWTQAAGEGPAPRSECGMAYDAQRQVIVLFGGRDLGTFYNDTWEFDGAEWEKVELASGPSARTCQNSLAYDPAGGRVVLFGGAGEDGAKGDTWEFDGATWFHTADTGPYNRAGAAMAYDSGRDKVVLFGGTNPTDSAPALGDTWEYQPGDMLGINWRSPMEDAAEYTAIPGGFDGFPAGSASIAAFPEELGPYPNAFTDGQGAVVQTNGGQVFLMLFPSFEVGDNTVLIRASVRSSGPGAAIALAALDPGDNSLGTNIPANSQIFTDEFKRMVITFDPPNNRVAPIFQVANIGNTEPVTVYMDNIEILLLPREKNRRIYGE